MYLFSAVMGRGIAALGLKLLLAPVAEVLNRGESC
jgi:hypothetical protein